MQGLQSQEALFWIERKEQAGSGLRNLFEFGG